MRHNELPAPLVPEEIDLHDFRFMPLDCVRLRESEVALRVSGDEFRCAVMLWAAAWHGRLEEEVEGMVADRPGMDGALEKCALGFRKM